MDSETDMVRQIRALDSDMQTLVYENYNKFISATGDPAGRHSFQPLPLPCAEKNGSKERDPDDNFSQRQSAVTSVLVCVVRLLCKQRLLWEGYPNDQRKGGSIK